VTSAPTQAFLHLQFLPTAVASVVSVVAVTAVAASVAASVVIHAGKHNLFRIQQEKGSAEISASLFYSSH
jgi:hypothetical protein